eukprot:CAMPEP_0206531144 /NCGR_PEP_ID=MMETSP0325_2-20121206/3596_1 /ASSEMBLY_ACC=CAM_ASM_000347 /TAXON_ID=2866 /ORGANISM="Crypthecodinium cohnii, Strain Seligo" /LENGTH=554 /DNA_ID=CAMNT_0054027343 /DNA_START=18 /DNA_END=1682 /DNA_ORIENTATION=+
MDLDLLASETIRLEGISEIVLDADESVGHLFLDSTGAIALDNEVTRRAIRIIVKAVNSQFGQGNVVQEEVDRLGGAVLNLDQTTVDQAKVLQSVQDSVTDLRIAFGKQTARMDLFERRLQQDRDTTALEAAIKKASEDLRTHRENIRDVAGRLETLERSVREELKRIATEVREIEETMQKHQESMDEETEHRLHEADESLLSLKLDLEACQVRLAETSKSKANRTEIEFITKNLKKVMESVQKDHETLEEAATNLERLEECINMANDNKIRCEEVSRVFKQEASELRDWTTRITAEVKETLRQKMDRTEAAHSLFELQQKLNGSIAALAQTTAQTQQTIHGKASMSSVQRLQQSFEDIKPPNWLPKRLLVGTSRCIACDRDLPPELDEGSMQDNIKTKQQEDLYHEVQKALERQLAGQGQMELLKYVSIHVGSPRRELSPTGVGSIDVRESESSPGSGHHLIALRPGSRPGGAGGAGLGGYISNNPAAAPMPQRCPPREPAPLARLPKRPFTSGATGNSGVGGGGILPQAAVNVVQRDVKGSPRGTLKHILASR